MVHNKKFSLKVLQKFFGFYIQVFTVLLSVSFYLQVGNTTKMVTCITGGQINLSKNLKNVQVASENNTQVFKYTGDM